MSIGGAEFFQQATLRISSTLEIQKALEDAFEFLSQHVPIETIALGYFDRESESIRTIANARLEGARYVWRGEGEETQLTQYLVELLLAPKEEPIVSILNQPSDLTDLAWLDAFPLLAEHSALSVKLDLQGNEVGVLLASASGLQRFSAEDAELLRSIREPVAIAMSNARRYQELLRIKDRIAEEQRALNADIKRALGTEVVGADFGLREVMEQVRQIAASSSPALLLGETGTGKEVIANAIHMASSRSQGPMISMQCGAVPDALLDSELFGHEKGAFTGALERKRGRFERADNGTLFLDEVGELSAEAQVKLLRVLQEQQLERVGGVETIKVNVRVIAATHRDLEQMVKDGTFREDLWYRLNVLPIRIPPLRLRREDVPSLVQYFVARKSREMNLPNVPRVSPDDLARLREYDWPGNVRELQNMVERALILSRDSELRFPALSNEPKRVSTVGDFSSMQALSTLDEVISTHIRSVLREVGGQVAGKGGAAEILQMNPSTLRFRMRKLGIKASKL